MTALLADCLDSGVLCLLCLLLQPRKKEEACLAIRVRERQESETPISLRTDEIEFHTSTYAERGWVGLHLRAKTRVP